MKKVVWIVNEYNFPDAIKSRQTNLCKQLLNHGYDAYIISGSSCNKKEKNRITSRIPYTFIETDEAKGYIIRTSDYNNSIERVLVSLQFQFRLWHLRNKLPKPDVIVSDFAGLFGYVFVKWKKRYKIRLIYDVLDLWPEGFVDMGYLKKDSIITKILYQLEHKTYSQADGIIFSMQGGGDYIVDKGWGVEVGGDIDTSDIGYLNNGVDIQAVDLMKEEYVLEDADLDSKKFKVVYLGSISEFNGLEILVDVAKILKEKGNDSVCILVYGYGNQLEKLKLLAQEYELTNLKFKGKLDKKYAMNLLSRSDINLFSFKNTPLLKYGISPNKLFMYFASGKPIISTVKPGYDLVETKHAGISVEYDPIHLVDAIEKFSSMDKDEYISYCKNSRQIAEEYDYKNLVNVLIKKIEGV